MLYHLSYILSSGSISCLIHNFLLQTYLFNTLKHICYIYIYDKYVYMYKYKYVSYTDICLSILSTSVLLYTRNYEALRKKKGLEMMNRVYVLALNYTEKNEITRDFEIPRDWKKTVSQQSNFKPHKKDL